MSATELNLFDKHFSMASRKRILETKGNPIKRTKTEPSSDSVESSKECFAFNKVDSSEKKIFSNKYIYILPAGIEKMRINIFKNQITKCGGTIYEQFDSTVLNTLSCIIVDDKMDTNRMCKLLHLESYPNVPVVKSSWLSSCLREKKILPFEPYLLRQVESHNVSTDNHLKSSTKATSPGPSQLQTFLNKNKLSDSNSNYSSSDEEKEAGIKPVIEALTNSKVKPEKWICAQSSKNPKPNFNTNITDMLEEMAKTYESTNDKWRAFGYQKAIKAIRNYPKPITSWEEAKSLPGVGGRLADKIWEIAQSGELRKLKEFESCEMTQVLKLFTNVWGAGPQTALAWYQQGLRTIDDLKQKAHLTSQQKVGVRLYDELLDRMPREEAGEIEKVVREAAESIQEGIIAQACGSYRRGKATCGDVDVLVTHPDGKSHKGIFVKLITKLKESGFLTDDLVSVEQTGNQKKYLGVCKLEGPNRKHRRLDIIVVPYSEYGCALVYFTGSAHFNRSLRHLCKTQNMSLNEHALKIGVVRKGADKIYEGTIVQTPTEESVFEALKIPYRPPEERDH
uniref:DNA polymerase n=1 Tax=Biomphalaria glabrata TaxID=6526 RepID=A0A2C9K182_BIOGL